MTELQTVGVTGEEKMEGYINIILRNVSCNAKFDWSADMILDVLIFQQFPPMSDESSKTCFFFSL